MKNSRKFSAAMTLAMLLSLTACGTADTNTDTASDTSAAETTSASVSSAEESAQETSAAETTEAETQAQEEATPAEYAVASLKGPTTMGMVKLMSDSEKGETFNKYNVSIHATADEIVAGVVSGSTDIANVPANLAAVLHKKTEGSIKVCDVNTLGVLYVVSSGEAITSIADLKGKTVYSTGKGTTPEYVFNHILRQNGLEPQTDVMIEYKTEASECAAVMAQSENAIAVLPQPYVTAAQIQNENIKISLSLTDEWAKVTDTPMITGVTIAQNAAIDENKPAFNTFLDEYQASVDFVNSNTDEAAALIGGYDIIKEPVARKALPYCNIALLRDSEMISAVKGYWNVLFTADPTAVGGAVPDDSAFYTNEG
ncbi:MAG: ABC transporter substrate-binding protein [Oscillospiraceae bacterium]|nr:ABC transporter substrate-binding protein [Oscillospiraceae bacterium]